MKEDQTKVFEQLIKDIGERLPNKKNGIAVDELNDLSLKQSALAQLRTTMNKVFKTVNSASKEIDGLTHLLTELALHDSPYQFFKDFQTKAKDADPLLVELVQNDQKLREFKSIKILG